MLLTESVQFWKTHHRDRHCCPQVFRFIFICEHWKIASGKSRLRSRNAWRQVETEESSNISGKLFVFFFIEVPNPSWDQTDTEEHSTSCLPFFYFFCFHSTFWVIFHLHSGEPSYSFCSIWLKVSRVKIYWHIHCCPHNAQSYSETAPPNSFRIKPKHCHTIIDRNLAFLNL